MPIKRSDVILGEKYAKAIAVINKSKHDLALLEAEKDSIFASMTQETQQSQVAIPPKYWHAEEVLEWVSHGTVKEPRTVLKAVELLNAGKLPGKFFDIKVQISAPYVSKVKKKIELHKPLQEGAGHPSKLDRFEIQFVHDTLEQQQITSKSLLLSTVQLLIRVILLIKRGKIAVEALDERVMLNNDIKKKRKRSQPPQRARVAEAQSDSDDTDNDESIDDRRAREESFRSIKKMLGDACSMSLADPDISRYPTRRQVRYLCSQEGWSVRKAQQTSCWRFEGCTPPMISKYFGNVIRLFIEFGIQTPGQKGNCDEKRLNAEFEKSARLLKVVCVKPTMLMSGRGRIAMTNSASSISIVGVTFLPFILADDTCPLIIIIRQGCPDSADSKQKEADIWNAVHEDFEKAGIEVVVMTTPSGYMIGDAFEHCVCHYMRAMLRREGVNITFIDPRNPTMAECPALKNAQILFLDNASHHKLGEVRFRCECRFRNLQLTPFPSNTTNVAQPLDQQVNRFFTMWVKQMFLLEMEIEMSGGIKNPLALLLWAQQVPMNAPALEVSMCVELDLTVDLSGNLDMSNTVRHLNATLARANTDGRKFDEVRVAKICCPAWIAALKYARQSFVAVGLAAPDVNLGPVLRHGRQSHLQLEHTEDMLTRYEVFPERITSTPVYQNAAEKWAKFQENAQQDKLELLTKGAQMVGALPDVRKRALTVASAAAERDERAAKAARLVFGNHPPEDAITVAKLLVHASTFVQDDEQRRIREEEYERRMPGGAVNIEEEMEQLRAAGIATMHEKLKNVHRSFEIVAEHALLIQKACAKLETQWQPLSEKENFTLSDVKKLQGLLVTISIERPKLVEKRANVEAELAKKIESRTKFIDSCRSDFVPEAQLKQAMVDNLDQDWGAGREVTIAGLAVARVVDFLLYSVATKVLAHVQLVDDEVRAVLVEMFGNDDVELPVEIPQ
jgi:hypothetical protein